MQIVHLRFKVLASRLSFLQLVDLAVASQRYNMHEVLMPFLSTWTAPHRQGILHPGKEQWLFIAYQFGYEADYRHLAKHMALNCRVDKDGNLLNTAGDVITGTFPDNALSKSSAVGSQCRY
jgi:hypothetical protein